MFNVIHYKKNANQNYNEVSQNGHHQKNLQINATERVEKRELSYTVGSNINWYSHYEEQYEGFLKTKRNYHMIKQSHSWAYIQEKKSN